MSHFSDSARSALDAARARKLSYSVRVVRAPDGRPVALLGEAHLKLARASDLGRRVVEAFPLRGIESFQRNEIAWGRALALVIEAPRAALRALSLGWIKSSTIVDARRVRTGVTFELEAGARAPLGLHVGSVYLTLFFSSLVLVLLSPLFARSLPGAQLAAIWLAFLFEAHLLALPLAIALRRRRWSWVVHPFLAILTLRDEIMAEGVMRMLAQHRDADAAVVVMGRAHGPGVERLLVERYGFTRATL